VTFKTFKTRGIVTHSLPGCTQVHTRDVANAWNGRTEVIGRLQTDSANFEATVWSPTGPSSNSTPVNPLLQAAH
jgi:hypothetical protein